jgi:diadenosine tetraphosphate (Ap4A) HIT family hydrolase
MGKLVPMENYGILSEAIKNEIADHFHGCRMCWAVSSAGQRFPENRIIFENETSVVIPGLGASTPGYLMLVSREHKGSLTTLSPDELKKLETELEYSLGFLERFSGSWSVFEHGVRNRTKPAGATIDHLHLHLIPLNFDITDQASRLLGQSPVSVQSMTGLLEAAGGNGENYLFIREAAGHCNAIFSPELPSQFLRRVTAAQVDRDFPWDWKESPMEEISLATLKELKRCGILKPLIYFAHSIEERDPEDVLADVQRHRDLLRRSKIRADLCSMYEIFERKFLAHGYFRDAKVADILVETEKRYIRSCDLVLADISIPGHQYVGALMEISYAHDMGIPVIAVAGDSPIGSRLWLKAHCRGVTRTVEEAVDLIDSTIFDHGPVPNNISI